MQVPAKIVLPDINELKTRIRLPAMAYYGVESTDSVYVSSDLEWQSVTDSAETRFTLSLRRNDPTTLAFFPFARDAMSLYPNSAPATRSLS